MTTVRFSKELCDRIEKEARNKMQPAVERAKAAAPSNDWGQRIYDTLFSEVIPAVNAVPLEWMNITKSFSVEKVGSLNTSLKFEFHTDKPWPRVFVANHLVAPCTSYNNTRLELSADPVWDEFAVEVQEYMRKVSEAELRRNEFTMMVSKVIQTHSTLAPALKMWPALWDLIPDDVKNRHREVKVRDKAEAVVDESIDLNKLTSMATAAKFGI
jgi:hypothetical protein